MSRDDIVDIGSRKQLFIDERFFARQYGTRLTVNPPVKAERVLLPQMPWEARSLGLYCTVLEDDGIYKLWYDAFGGLKVPRECIFSIFRGNPGSYAFLTLF